MSTYFIYFDNPVNEIGLEKYLKKYKAELFEIGYIIKSEESPRNIYMELYQNVMNKGFIYMTGSAHPEIEHSFPPKARTQYLRRDSDLDKAVCKFIGTFANLAD
jgi:hypothetical protein